MRFRHVARALVQPSTDPVAAPRAWGSPSELALAGLGFCTFGVLLLHPQLRAMWSLPDAGDPLFSIWRMGWVYRQLLGDPRPLFDANIFHPEPLAFAYSDAMLLPSLAAAPLFGLGLHPLLVYNLVFLSGFLLSGLATHLLVRRLTGSPRAAFVASVIYGFYPYRFEHYSHLELQMTQWMPLGLLAIHRFVDTRRVRDAILATLVAVAQLYSSMYYGLYFVLYAGVVALVLVTARRIRPRALCMPLAAALVIGTACAIPLARPYMASQARRGERDAAAVREYSAEPTDYLRAHPRSPMWGPLLLSGRKPERALFPGASAIVLSAVALVPPFGVTRLAYAAGLLVAFDGSLGFNGLTYRYFYEALPPVRGLRVPARLSVLAGLSLAVLAGFGVRRLFGNWRDWRREASFAALVAALAIDLRPSVPLVGVWMEPPSIYDALEPGTGVVLAEFPMPFDPPDFARNLPYMYFSVWHGASMVNGYSGHAPPDYAGLMPRLAGFPDEGALAVLRQRGVTHVTVNCALFRDGCADLVEACRQTPALRPLVQARWQGAAVHLYALTP